MVRRRSPAPILLLILGLVALPASLAAAPPEPTCNGNESLTGEDTFPFSGSTTAPMTDDFTMTASGCSEQGVDNVVCFRPTNNCSVDITCTYTGTTVGANLFPGTCNTSPSSCAASASGADSATITNASLTGGNDYCVVCESVGNLTALGVSITETSGSCGAVPVTLESFSIEK